MEEAIDGRKMLELCFWPSQGCDAATSSGQARKEQPPLVDQGGAPKTADDDALGEILASLGFAQYRGVIEQLGCTTRSPKEMAGWARTVSQFYYGATIRF